MGHHLEIHRNEKKTVYVLGYKRLKIVKSEGNNWEGCRTAFLWSDTGGWCFLEDSANYENEKEGKLITPDELRQDTERQLLEFAIKFVDGLD